MKLYPLGREVSLVVCLVMQVGKIAEEMLLVHLKPLVANHVEEASVVIQFILYPHAETEVAQPYVGVGDFGLVMVEVYTE